MQSLAIGFEQEHGSTTVRHDPFRDAPGECSSEARASMCGDHNQVRFAGLRRVGDELGHRRRPNHPIDCQTTVS